MGCNLRGFSHYAIQVERPLPKLLLRGEGRSPLKYIMSVLLIDFKYFIEKIFGFLTRVWVSILCVSKHLLRGKNFGTKSAKKCCHVGTLKAFYLWSLAIRRRGRSCSPPIKLLHFLHLSTNGHSIKTPLLHLSMLKIS